MIPSTRAKELARLYSDPDGPFTHLDALARDGFIRSDDQRSGILRELRGRTLGATKRECCEIRALIDFALGAPLTSANDR
jgi:hypothetical protein